MVLFIYRFPNSLLGVQSSARDIESDLTVTYLEVNLA